MNSTSSAQALAAHLIGQTLGSVALLESLSFITPSDARAIRSRLSLPAGPSPAAALLPQADLTSSFGSIDVAGVPSSSYGQPSIPSLPKRNSGFGIKARALWDYGGTEPDDLAFKAGDTIVIDEEVNEQWYRGRLIPKGHTFPLDNFGLFPANYVEKNVIAPHTTSYSSASPPPIDAQAVVHHQAPVLQQSYYAQKPSIQQGHMVVMPQQQSGMIVQDQQEGRKYKLGKIGGQLQHAAVSGAGFGFGSAVASNLVNKIL